MGKLPLKHKICMKGCVYGQDTLRYSAENLVLSNLPKDMRECQDHTTIRPFCTACLIYPQPGTGQRFHTDLSVEGANNP